MIYTDQGGSIWSDNIIAENRRNYRRIKVMLTAIAGINWGDEGKGRMVDLLSADYDIVVRLSLIHI